MERTAFKGIIKTILSLLTAGISLTACNTVYDDISDCDTELRIKFKYDYNMKFADAFYHEVKSVHLYAYDENGNLALSKTEAVSGDNFLVNVDELKPEKKYNFVVWAEGENRGDSYTYGPDTKEENLTTTINTTTENNLQVLKHDITPLFHGRETAQVFKREFGTTQTITIPLVKNTNNIKVVLQQKDPNRKMNKDDFTLTITDDNARMNYDNSLMTGGNVIYSPWSVTSGTVTSTDNQSTAVVSSLITEFTIGRLVKEGHKPVLTIRNKDGKLVLSIPLIDYMLLVKGNYNKDMSDQEYLDRQDTYDMVFFLDGETWDKAAIYINSWRVVPAQGGNM